MTSISQDEITPEKWLATYTVLLDSVMARWDRERAESPHTVYDYAPRKEMRYCDPVRWLDIEASAESLLLRLLLERSGFDKIREGAPLLSNQKECALIWARAGIKIEERLPGFLEACVKRGDFHFLEKLSVAMNEESPNKASAWKAIVAAFWAKGLGRLWPLCFWTDEAIISHLSEAGLANLTIKQWRDFRKEAGLVEPPHIIVREFALVPSRQGGEPSLLIRCKPKKNPRFK